MSTIDRSLSGKVALISGAASGIGAATAREFARRGVVLALTDRNETDLQRVADDCRRHLAEDPSNAQRPLAIVGELTAEEDVKRIVSETVEKLGRLDILVNSAGIFEVNSIEAASLEQFDRVMNVNLRAAFHVALLAVPHLIASKGCVINVSSTSGSHYVKGMIVYSMSKSAVDQMTRCMALELAGKGVRVNSVNPAVIRTGLYSAAGMDDKAVENLFERRKATYPLGRVGEPEEVARAIAFLSSSDASFTTGEQFYVDGGFHVTSAS